jgi:hypothetical protein
MGIDSLIGYLIGSRSALLTLAEHPRTWLIGLVFVLSAGFAREYDGEDLLHEPWHLLLPLGASLVSSLVLFCVLYVPSRMAGAAVPSFIAAYRAFLGLFWMTAPLAWLYAVPYERFLDPISAAYANVYTLAFVSACRVALMVRVGVVLFGLSPWAAFFRVVAYADSAALVAIHFLPFPIIEVMGGVRVSEADMPVRSAAQFVACWGGCSLIFWWLLAIVAGNRSTWALPWRQDANPADSDGVAAIRHVAHVSWPLRILAFASLAVWIPILPFTQPEQQIRWRVETAFREGRFRDALNEMSAQERDDFPPQWEPPPRFLKGDRSAMVLDIWKEILSNEPAPWVRQHYLDRFKEFVEIHAYERDDEKVANLLNQMPESKTLLREWAANPRMQSYLERLDTYLRPELRRTNLKRH